MGVFSNVFFFFYSFICIRCTGLSWHLGSLTPGIFRYVSFSRLLLKIQCIQNSMTHLHSLASLFAYAIDGPKGGFRQSLSRPYWITAHESDYMYNHHLKWARAWQNLQNHKWPGKDWLVYSCTVWSSCCPTGSQGPKVHPNSKDLYQTAWKQADLSFCWVIKWFYMFYHAPAQISL